MLLLTFKEAAQAVGSDSPLEGSFTGISTDTRKITPGCLFIALKGERFDGNEFASKAVEEGALCAVVERDCGLGEKQIIVENNK